MSSKHAIKNKNSRTSLPSINLKLGNLCANHDVLEYYQSRLNEFIADHNIIEVAMKQLKKTIDNQYNLRENEFEELQKALSDMTIALFNEKHRYLKLQNENDRIMLKHFENKKKIETLLKLTNLSENEINYFFKGPKSPSIRNSLKTSSTISQKGNSDKSGSLKSSQQNELESFNAHLSEQRELSRAHIEALKEDYKIRQLEIEYRKNNDRNLIFSLSDKLHSAHKIIFEKNKLLLDLMNSLKQNDLSITKNPSILKGILKKNKTGSSNSDKACVKENILGQNNLSHNNKHHRKKDGIKMEDIEINTIKRKRTHKNKVKDNRGNNDRLEDKRNDFEKRTDNVDIVTFIRNEDDELLDFDKGKDNAERQDNCRKVRQTNSNNENEHLKRGQNQDCQLTKVRCMFPPILKNATK